MRNKPRIKDTVKRLGLKFDLKRRKESPPVPRFNELVEKIDELKEAYAHLGANGLRSSQTLTDEIRLLFDDYGVDLWPPPGIDTSAWLLDAAVDDHGGLHPRNLHYCIHEDQIRLRRNFYELIYTRIDHYHPYRQQRQRTEISRATSRRNSELQMEEVIELSSDESERSDCDSDYAESMRARHVSSHRLSGIQMMIRKDAYGQVDAPVAQMTAPRGAAWPRSPRDDDHVNGVECDNIQVGANGRIPEAQNRPQPLEGPSDQPELDKKYRVLLPAPAPSYENAPSIELSGQKHSRDLSSDEGSPGREAVKHPKLYNTHSQQQALIVTLKPAAQKLATIDRSNVRQDLDPSTTADDNSSSSRHQLSPEHCTRWSSLTKAVEKGKQPMRPLLESPPASHPQSDTELAFECPASWEDGVGLLGPASVTSLRGNDGSRPDDVRDRGTHYDIAALHCRTHSMPTCGLKPPMGHKGRVSRERSTEVTAEPAKLIERSIAETGQQRLVQHCAESSTTDPNKDEAVTITNNAIPHNELDVDLPSPSQSEPNQSTSEHVGPLGAQPDQVTVDEGDIAISEANIAKNEKETKQKSLHPTPEPLTAFQQAKVFVWWPNMDRDCPDFVKLQCCGSYADVFAQLEECLPEEFEEKRIRAAKIKLANAEATEIVESPNGRMLAVGGEAAFENLVEVLEQYTPHVRPKLELTVEFWK